MTPDAVLEMIRRNRQPTARIAIVTAVTTSPLAITVRFEEGGATFQPLILGNSTTPTVGARVLLVPANVGWVYVSTVLTPGNETSYDELYLPLVHNWEIAQRADSSWFQLDHGTAQFFQQGHLAVQAGSDDVLSPGVYYDSGAILDHAAPATFTALAAQSATIQLVDMQIRRNTGGPDLVSPVMYGHAYDAANPPPQNAPPWAPGFGPLRLSPLGRFETGRYTLPSTWVTALAAGTIRGVGFWATTTSDAMFSDDSWQGQIVAARNMHLRIVYSLPS